MSTVLITGASRGIGKALAKKFAQNSYDLVINCIRSKDTLEALALEFENTCHITCIPCAGDVSDPLFVAEMFQKAREALGGIDILINNAGIADIGLFHEMSIERWQQIINTNLSSVFYCCRQAAPHMIQNKSGRIINISSVWGVTGASCEAAYSAAKGGVNAFTRALAKELAPSNIQVNAIACGAIDTQMNACFSSEEKAALEEEIPCGRYGTPEEVAELAFSLAVSPSYLTGQIIGLDGGWI